MLLGDRRLALEVAGAGLERRAAPRRRDGELLAGLVAAGPRIPGPAVGREADLLQDVFDRFDRGARAVHRDFERRADFDLDAVGKHRSGSARRLGRPHDRPALEQLVLGAEQRVVEAALAGQDIDEAEVDAVHADRAGDPFQGAEAPDFSEAAAGLALFL